MDVRKKRIFLIVSNIIISVLAAVSIAFCFIMPIWKVEFSVAFTEEMGEALKNASNTSDNGASVRFTSGSQSGISDITDLLPDGFLSTGKEAFNSFVDALCEANFSVSFSQSFSSADMICALYDQDPRRAEQLIDNAVDSFVDDTERIINDFLQTAVKAAAKEMVKTTVSDMLKENYDGENYDQFLSDLGTDKERMESLVEGIIDSVMKDGATVDSVTDKVLESADEAQQILSKIPKFSDQANTYDDEDRESIREATKELLSNFADEDGKINFKDSLIQVLLSYASQAVEQLQQNAGNISASGMSATTGGEAKQSTEESVEDLKTQIKKLAFNSGDGFIAKLIVGVMAAAGALILVLIFMLFYPILRTLTNIGKDNPGFIMFLPVFGGISSYLFLVILPSVFPGIIRLLGSAGGVLSLPPAVTAVLNAFSLRFSSGTIVAFIFAIVLFIFSFFYDYQRRSVKKALSKGN
jgi:hypothetical protein